MLNLYSAKRREPRVRLRTRISLSGTDTGGDPFSVESVTIDVSPHGASVLLERDVAIGAQMEFQALKYAFATRAIVRSVYRDRFSGSMAVGLEFLGDTQNPLVIWSSAHGTPTATHAD